MSLVVLTLLASTLYALDASALQIVIGLGAPLIASALAAL